MRFSIPGISRWRVMAGILLVLALAVYNILGLVSWSRLGSPTRLDTDEVSAYIKRFEELRDTLRFYRVAGYRDDGQYAAGWFLAQYSLAPTVLVQGAQQPVVVANFHSDSSPEKIWVEDSLRLIHDYGQRVRLYEGLGQ
jgi:hypothetical protein